MDFELDEAHRLLRDTVANWAEREIGPIAAEIDRRDEFPMELWPKMGDLGILGVTVDPEYGGAGFDLLAGVLAIEQIARFSGSVALSYGAHANLCVHNLFRNGNEEQRRRYLPPLCAGDQVGRQPRGRPDDDRVVAADALRQVAIGVDVDVEALAEQRDTRLGDPLAYEDARPLPRAHTRACSAYASSARLTARPRSMSARASTSASSTPASAVVTSKTS